MSNVGLRAFALNMMGEIDKLGQLALGFPTDGEQPEVQQAMPLPQFGQQPMQQPMQQPVAPQPMQQQPAMPEAPSGVVPQAWGMLNGLQETFGPLNVISSYRDPERNAAVGGAQHSRHMQGDAFDIDVRNMPTEQRLELIKEARARGFGGVGVYDNSIHLDLGPERAWGPSHHSDSIPEWASEAVGASRQGDVTMSSSNQPSEWLSTDTSDLEAIEEEPEDEFERRRAAAVGFFKGLGQMSRGQEIDATDVMDSFYERQAEARQRMMEIAKERRRREEVNVGHQWDVERDDRLIQAQIAKEERDEARDRAEEAKLLEQETARRARLAQSLRPLMVGLPEEQQVAITALVADDPDVAVGRLDDAQDKLAATTAAEVAASRPTEAQRTLEFRANALYERNSPEWNEFVANGGPATDDASAKEAEIASYMQMTKADGSPITLDEARGLAYDLKFITPDGRIVDKLNETVTVPTPAGGTPAPVSVPTSGEEASSVDPGQSLDLSGVVKDTLNMVAGFTMLGAPFPKAQEAQVAMDRFKLGAIEAFTSPISDRPSTWTQQLVTPLLPNWTDGPENALVKYASLQDAIRTEMAELQEDYISRPNDWAGDTKVVRDAQMKYNALQSTDRQVSELIAGLRQGLGTSGTPSVDDFWEN